MPRRRLKGLFENGVACRAQTYFDSTILDFVFGIKQTNLIIGNYEYHSRQIVWDF